MPRLGNSDLEVPIPRTGSDGVSWSFHLTQSLGPDSQSTQVVAQNIDLFPPATVSNILSPFSESFISDVIFFSSRVSVYFLL